MDKYIIYCCFSAVILLASSCGSVLPRQPQITDEILEDLPNLSGKARIPMQINLQRYFHQADQAIDRNFYGKEEQCDGISYQYYFKRKPLNFSGKKQTISYSVDGEYNIRANYCAKCASVFSSSPYCLTPRLYVSCGVGEPLRKISIGFESRLTLRDNYLLDSETKLTRVKTIDPCTFSFMKYDVSQLIEEEMGTYLKTMEREIDDQIEKIDLRTPISEAWEVMQKEIEVPSLGYLYFRPKSIEIEPITFNGVNADVAVGVELSPVFSSDKINAQPINLPFLSPVKSKEGFALPLLTLMSYDSINSILRSEITGMTIPFQKKQIVILSAEVLGPVGKQLLFKVNFGGSKKGILYLLGTPTYNAETKEIHFPDLAFDLRTKDALLKSAKWLFDKKLTEIFCAQAKFNVEDQIETARVAIEKELNNSIEYAKGQFANMEGKLSEIAVQTIQVRSQELGVFVELRGSLSLNL